MTSRKAVIEIAQIGRGRLGARLLRSQGSYPDALSYQRLRLDHLTGQTLDTSANVDSYATEISEALCLHPAIRAELGQIAATAPSALRFQVSVPNAEALRWETVSMQPYTRFLALKPDCVVTRIAQSSDIRDPGMRTFEFPIRMLAFLSPAQVRAADEFHAICGCVRVAREAGLDLTCSIYLGEQTLLDDALAQIASDALPGIKVAGMPSSARELEHAIREAAPQILHFFCHGMTQAGEHLLEFATINDWDIEQETGSVVFAIERLRQILISLGTAWLTVLNSCLGARTANQLHSMALALAQDASPVTVGMAERIDAADATVFARAFYESLFEILRSSLTGFSIGDAGFLDLTAAVNAARTELHEQYRERPPEAFGRWCLPLLYERDAPLKVMMGSEETRTRIELVAGILRSLPMNTPRTVRENLLASLATPPCVPECLRPDAFGNLA